MINSTLAEQRIRDSLVGFPARVISAYRVFAENGNAADLDVVVLGVLHFYLAKKPVEPLETLPGTMRLVEDLGCDSLTMLDTVFMVEALFEIKIYDAELAQIKTLDDLRRHLHQLVSGTAVST